MSNMIQKFNVDQGVRDRILEKISQFNQFKILLIGDVGIDEYIMGAVKRISPEAPVPVLEVQEEDKRLGLAANVAQNIVSLGGQVHLVSVIGSDDGAVKLKKMLSDSNVSTAHLVIENNRPTTRKTRIISGHHHLVRVDHEVKKNLSAETEDEIFKQIEKVLHQSDVIILEDYAKGLFSKGLIKKIIKLAQDSKKYLMVDPHQTQNADFYKGVNLIKPNYNEALALTAINEDEIENVSDGVFKVGRKLQKMTEAHDVVLTQGQNGMSIFSYNSDPVQVPTFAKKVFDVTGAGDTVIAALSLGIASGLKLAEACVLANYAAGIVVGKVGCVPCFANELVAEIK